MEQGRNTEAPTDVGRAAWLRERRTGIGGTDAAAILGVSPWATAYDVWLEKRGEAPARPDNEAMWWGRELEDLVARRYSEKTGYALFNPEGLVRHPQHDILIASPDRLVVGERRGLEVKTASPHSYDQWGPEGSDTIPAPYLVQVCHYMMVTGYPVWDLAVLIGGSDHRIYTVHRDLEFEELLRERLLAWWQTFILDGLHPPITDSPSTSALLARRFPLDVAPLLEADAGAVEWMKKLHVARREADAAVKRVGEATNNLKAYIGEASGVQGEGYKATWKATKGSTDTDWRAIAEELRSYVSDGAVFISLVEKHTRETPGVRRFLFTPPKGQGGNAS